MPQALPEHVRDQVVAVARRGGASFSQIAKDFGVSKSYVQKWVRIAESGPAERDSEAEAAERRAATRARLSELALEIFAREGFEETSVAAIAQAAGITERTFFNYFDTKLDAVFRRREYTGFGQLRSMILAEPAGGADLDVLFECGIRYMSGELTPAHHHSNGLRNRISESSDTVRGVRVAARENLASTMANSLAERHGRGVPTVADEALAAAAAAVLHQCFIRWVEGDDPAGFEALARDRVAIFLSATRR